MSSRHLSRKIIINCSLAYIVGGIEYALIPMIWLAAIAAIASGALIGWYGSKAYDRLMPRWQGRRLDRQMRTAFEAGGMPDVIETRDAQIVVVYSASGRLHWSTKLCEHVTEAVLRAAVAEVRDAVSCERHPED